MKKYIIRAALHDETNEGWIWTTEHPSRTVVRIVGADGKQKIYCIARKIDDNFLNLYNQTPKEKRTLATLGKKCRINIDSNGEFPTVVMGQWYRDALGIADKDRKEGPVSLDIRSFGCWPFSWWGAIRAAAHHPDIVVRIGISLGVLGFGLGLVALMPPLLRIFKIEELCQSYIVVVGSIIAGFIGWLSCRRPSIH